jgi:hypothetical protein
LTLDSEENFQDGIETKYILLPINKDGVVNEKLIYSTTKCSGVANSSRIMMDLEKIWISFQTSLS